MQVYEEVAWHFYFHEIYLLRVLVNLNLTVKQLAVVRKSLDVILESINLYASPKRLLTYVLQEKSSLVDVFVQLK